MNLASMIRSAALANAKTVVQATPNANKLKNLLLGPSTQSAKALARYLGVMKGRGWMTQNQIESALGHASTSSTRYLNKLMDEGHVERRGRDGKTYCRRRGYEWRVLE